jgi:CIC family chloride channel protein
VGLRRFRRNDQLVLGLLSTIVGAIGGLAAIAFRTVIDTIQFFGFGSAPDQIASAAASLEWWHVLGVPTFGGLLVGLFVYRFMPEGRPQGVAHVIEAAALRGGQMSLMVGVRAARVSAASIGFGASVGREGPVVHLGASLASWTAQVLHLDRSRTRTLLGCGVAAAVAASFNAPIAGVFFALEVVVGHYALSAFAPIVIAGVFGTLISRMHYGDFPAFVLPQAHSIGTVWEFPAFMILGLVSALAAVLFMRSIIFSEGVFRRFPGPVWIRPALGGLAVGLMALVFPQVLGVGYGATDAALQERYGLWLLLALVVAKTAATGISIGSGFGGGVFSPSLFVGAMVGGAYGIIAGSAFPDLASSHGAYTIIGMAAVAGAVLGAPISTILIVFEMTGDYALTIALMIATAIASVTVQQVGIPSFFIGQLQRRGVKLTEGHETRLLADIKIRSLLDRNYATVPAEAPLAEVRKALVQAPFAELMVIDGHGALLGTITFADFTDSFFDTSKDEKFTARDVARVTPPLLLADDSLGRAIEVFRECGEAHIPVVDSKDDRKLLGLAHEHETMAAYHRTLMAARAEERGEAASRFPERP